MEALFKGGPLRAMREGLASTYEAFVFGQKNGDTSVDLADGQ